LPRYHVVLLGDKAQELLFIMRTVMELTRYGREEATHRMWQAHHTGRAVILTTHMELAELFAERFAERGLRVDLEPA
jgi:ATP-dependent Clp protease adaptor protein ClpS